MAFFRSRPRHLRGKVPQPYIHDIRPGNYSRSKRLKLSYKWSSIAPMSRRNLTISVLLPYTPKGLTSTRSRELNSTLVIEEYDPGLRSFIRRPRESWEMMILSTGQVTQHNPTLTRIVWIHLVRRCPVHLRGREYDTFLE